MKLLFEELQILFLEDKLAFYSLPTLVYIVLLSGTLFVGLNTKIIGREMFVLIAQVGMCTILSIYLIFIIIEIIVIKKERKS